MKILSGNGNRALASKICGYLQIPLGGVEVGRFPDGEISVRITEDVRGRDIFIVQPTCPPVNDNLMELLILIDAARRASASRVTVVMPYYGYGRKDRKDEGRVPITAKLVANLITRAGADRILALDLHATQIQGFFDCPVDHLFAKPVIAHHFCNGDIEDVVFVAPDVGRAKMARAYAEDLGTGLAIVDKRRASPNETEVGFVIGDVRGKNVVLIDDMISTGGSLVNAATALLDKGAASIRAAVVHGVFCGPADERLGKAPINEILTTDTIPLNEAGRNLQTMGKLHVLSVAGLLGEAIHRIHMNESVSSLFTRSPKESTQWVRYP